MTAAWKTIRVFISSTFRDMHAERDYLVKVVFPALRERLEKYRIHFVDIDLRWGITEEEAQQDRVLDLCLEQIDDCRPFFVGILGERYGWVPKSFSDEAASKYGWVQHQTGKSVTELEIVYGVLRDPKMHAHGMFFFRNPAFIDDVPEAKRADLQAEDDEARDKLAALKHAIRDTPLAFPPMENYPCRYAGLRINWTLASRELASPADREELRRVAEDGLVDPDEYRQLSPKQRELVHRFGVVHLAGLEEFGRRVSEQLWQAIQAEHKLPDTPPMVSLAETDPLAEEAAYHEEFIESRLRVYVGREKLQKDLVEFAEGQATVPCLVTGPSGAGKSAAMARFVRSYTDSHPKAFVIPHFVGASPGSTNLRHMLRRFCLMLQQRFALKDEMKDDVEALIALFRRTLERVPGGGRVVLVIDALDQLEETDNAYRLHWLPLELPARVKIVASCQDASGSPAPPSLPPGHPGGGQRDTVLEVFRHRPRHEIVVGPLTSEERLQIIREVPLLSAKRFDAQQVKLLQNNPATTNPLFLLVALEELRGFGSFEQLTRRIEQFPREGDTVTALFRQMLGRLEREFDPNLVRSVLTLLASARRGLSEQELQELTAPLAPTEGGAAGGDLFPLLRQLRPYLARRGGLIRFFHRNLDKAVHEQYLPNEQTRTAAHAWLADYFRRVGHQSRRTLEELPFQAAEARNVQLLETTLCDLDFLESKCVAGMASDLMMDYLRLNGLGLSKPRSIDEFADFVRARLHILVAHADLTFQEAANWVEGTAPRQEANRREASNARKRAWIRWLNRPTGPAGAPMTLVGHRSAIKDIAVSPDGAHIASASEALRIWDSATGELLITIGTEVPYSGEYLRPDSCAFSPDGSCIVTMSSLRSRLCVWDSKTGVLRTAMDAKGRHRLNRIRFAPDGRTFVTAFGSFVTTYGSGGCIVWNAQTVEPVQTVHGSSCITGFAISPDGRILITAGNRDVGSTGGSEYRLRGWDLKSGHEVRECRHKLENWIDGCEWIPHSTRLIVCRRRRLGARSAALQVFDAQTGDELYTLGTFNSFDGPFAVSPDGKQVVSAVDQGTLVVHDIASRHLLGQMPGHGRRITSCMYTPDGRRIICGDEDGKLRIWNTETLHPPSARRHHAGAVAACEFSPDSSFYISLGADDHTIRIWDGSTHGELRSIEVPGAASLAMSPCGKQAALGIESAPLRRTRIRLLDLQTGRVSAALCSRWRPAVAEVWQFLGAVSVVTLGGAMAGVLMTIPFLWILFLPKPWWGFLAAIIVGYVFMGLAYLLELRRGKSTTACGFAPTGQYLVSGQVDGGMHFWDVLGKCEIFSPKGVYSPWAWLREAERHKDVKKRSDSLRLFTGVTRCTYSRDGERLLLGQRSGKITLWDAQSHRQLATRHVNQSGPGVCAFSPDGKRVAISQTGTRIDLCDARDLSELASFEAHDRVITACRFSASGRLIATCSVDGSVKIHEVDDGRLVAQFRTDSEFICLAWRPEGDVLVCGNNNGTVFALQVTGGEGALR